jgi:hypothetical protein
LALVAGLLLAAGFVLAAVLVLAVGVFRPDVGADDEADVDDADDDGADDVSVGVGGVDGEDDESGLRGRTGPFPLPPGGVPLEFNAVSPLWRHHQLPALYIRCWQ